MTSLTERKPLALPNGNDKGLMHSYCAPCSGEVMLVSGIGYSIYFQNATSIRTRNKHSI